MTVPITCPIISYRRACDVGPRTGGNLTTQKRDSEARGWVRAGQLGRASTTDAQSSARRAAKARSPSMQLREKSYEDLSLDVTTGRGAGIFEQVAHRASSTLDV